MTKQDYTELVAQIRRNIADLEETQKQIRDEYIEMNRPCQVDDTVEIVLRSGRKVTGLAKQFGILSDKEVCVTGYSESGKMKYITTPYQSIKIVSNE